MVAKSTVTFNANSRNNKDVTERGMHGSRDNIFLNKFIYQKLRAEYVSSKRAMNPEGEGQKVVI